MKKEIFLDGPARNASPARHADASPAGWHSDAGGQKIVYFKRGIGFPFLIIHGWGGKVSPIQNIKFQKLLAKKGFEVFLISLPGFGESYLPTLKTGEDEITESVLKFADKLNLKQFFLYGHCFGALIAVKLVKLYPKRIKGLILCAPPSVFGLRIALKFGFPGLVIFLIIAEMSHVLLPPIYLFKKLRSWLSGQFKFYIRGKGAMWRACKRIMLQDFKEIFLNIAKIKIPTLVIRGSKENIIVKKGFKFFKKIPNSVSKIIPDVGHSIQLDAPQKLVEEIANFTKTIKG